METWAPVLGAILAALVAAAVSVLNSRNDRAMSNLEADLLKKLDPQTEAARQLHAVIEARVNDWYRKAYKIKKTSTGEKWVQRRNYRVIIGFVVLWFLLFLVVLVPPIAVIIASN